MKTQIVLGLVFALLGGVVGCSEDCPAGTMPLGEGCAPIADAGTGDADADVGGDSCTARTFYRDGDGDGFGVEDDAVSTCDAPPEGYADVPVGDCDDAAAAINPNASESCDDVDQDCDGAVDEGRLGMIGSPLSFAEHGRSPSTRPNIDAIDGGYLVVWEGDTGIRSLKLDASGSVMGTQEAVDMASVGDGQFAPSMAVVHTSGGPLRPVVSWRNDAGAIRARALRLDALTPPASVIVSAGDATALFTVHSVAAWGEHALVTWGHIRDGEPEVDLSAVLLDPTTGLPTADPLVIASTSATSAFATLGPQVSILEDGSAVIASFEASTRMVVATRLEKAGSAIAVAGEARAPVTDMSADSQVLPLVAGPAVGILYAPSAGVGYSFLPTSFDGSTASSVMVDDALTHAFAAQHKAVVAGLSGTSSSSTIAVSISQLVRTGSELAVLDGHLFDIRTDAYFGMDVQVASPSDAVVVLGTDVAGSPDLRFVRLGCR